MTQESNESKTPTPAHGPRTTKRLNRPSLVAVVVCVVAFIAAGVWLGVLSMTNNSTTEKMPEGAFQVPTFSVKQQVASATGVSADELRDTDKRVRIKSTIVDEAVFQEGDTIDKLMDTPETAGQSLLTQVESTGTLYDYNADTYAVKLDNISASKLTSGVKDIAFARDNYNGEVVGDITFDENTGIAYVPKAAIDDYVPVDASQDEGNVLQAQLLYTMPSDRVEDVAIQTCTLTNEATGESVETYAGSEMISNYTYVQLVSEEDADKVDTSSIKVNANDGAVQTNSESAIETASDVVAYNKETGMLRIQNNAATLGNLSVSLAASDKGTLGLSSHRPDTIWTVAQAQFLTDSNGKEVVFKNLNGTSLKNLLNSRTNHAFCFYSGGTADVFTGGDYLGDNVYISANLDKKAEEGWDDPVDGSKSTAWTIADGDWERIDAKGKLYNANDAFRDMDGFPAPNNDRYQPKFTISLNGTSSFPMCFNDPTGLTDSQAVYDAGIQAGGSWDYLNPIASALSMKAWCTHISSEIKPQVDGAGTGQILSRVLAVDDYHVTMLFIGGPQDEIDGQTGSCIIKIKIASIGNVEIEKSSTNQAMTDGNACYSLEGAQYQLYWTYDTLIDDGSVWDPIDDGLITTDKDGKAFKDNIWLNEKAVINRNTGNYENAVTTIYAKEVKAPPGFALDTTGGFDGKGTYKIEFTTTEQKRGQALAKVVTTETPQNDPITVLIQKTSKDGKRVSGSDVEKQSQGAATYKDAHFTVRYYQTTDPYSLSKDYKTRCAAANRKWIYTTNENGVVNIQKQTPLAGSSPVYTKKSGAVVFPVGTYVIEESRAPAGFMVPEKCDKRTFIITITGDGSENEHGITKSFFKPTETISADKGYGISYNPLGWTEWTVSEIIE